MSYIYEISSDFDLKVKAKYVWGDEIFESKYKEHVDKNYPIESDYFNTEYYMELGIQTGKYWGDVLFTNGFNILLKKSLYEKMVENGFVNGYKTYKVINTVKGGPEYVGIVVIEESIKIPEENLKYVERTWGLSAEDFVGIDGMEKGNDFFLVRGVGGTYITEKLYNFLQENADVGNVEFKKIECR